MASSDPSAGTGANPVNRENLLNFHWHQLEPLAGLNVRDFNLQENIDWITTLQGMIRVEGVRTPLHVVVRDGRRFITAGECRWRAVKGMAEAGEEVPLMPCLPEPKGTNDMDLNFRLEADNTQKPFNPLEVGFLIKRLINFGQSQTQIAARWGKSVSWVSGILELEGIPEAIKVEVGAGNISATEAVKVARREGDAAVAVVKEAVKIAHASGQKKATGKHVSRAAPGSAYKVVERGGNLTVAIDGKKFTHPWKYWRGLADEIVEAIEKAEAFRAEQSRGAVEEASVAA